MMLPNAAMNHLLDLLLTRTWWTYDPGADWYAQPYHWINLLEGAAWLVFAGLVLARYVRNRRSKLEWLYALAFVTFGLSDFREVYVVQSWLILAKGVNLGVLFYLRHLVISRYYPQSKTY